MNPGYELVDHTADIGIRARGRDRAEVYEQAAAGMFSLICDPMTVQSGVTVDVTVEAAQPDLLLAAWLNELLYRFEADRVLFSGFEVTEINDTRLRAKATGEPLDSRHHGVCGGVKAATLHQLSLRPCEGGWVGFVLLDV